MLHILLKHSLLLYLKKLIFIIILYKMHVVCFVKILIVTLFKKIDKNKYIVVSIN